MRGQWKETSRWFNPYWGRNIIPSRKTHSSKLPLLGQGIHSFILAISIEPLQVHSTPRCSRLPHGNCVGVSRRSAQANVSKGLAQGPYVAARARVEPTTLRLKAIDSTKAPPCPTVLSTSSIEARYTERIREFAIRCSQNFEDVQVATLVDTSKNNVWRTSKVDVSHRTRESSEEHALSRATVEHPDDSVRLSWKRSKQP